MSSWRSVYGFASYWFLSFLVGWTTLRVILLVNFKPEKLSAGQATLALLSGLHRDLFVALLYTLPVLLWLLVLPPKWRHARWHRFAFWGACSLFWYIQIFLFFVEYFFFDEFKSRFNTVAVDYLLYPYEVFVNIWQSYNVVAIVGICLALTVGWVWLAKSCFRGIWEPPLGGRRWAPVGLVVIAVLALLPTIDFKRASFSKDRALNEMGNNGAISFMAAAVTHHLDYAAFYQTMDKGEAYRRVRAMLQETNATFSADGQSIRRRVMGDPGRPKLNVVLILEESLGSEFWGCLGAKRDLTPEMDRLAINEGVLFTNMYACGNRTVRGMEGVLSSFPPLPGDSIVKRDRSDNVESLARVLKRDGYSTLFLYGGRGVFDGMRSYAVRNGYDRFVEQKHFKNPTFTTVWGVCDEDLFGRTIQECRELSRTNSPFFATVLTVSNHRPYTYPKGRIPEDPAKKWRRNAVKYADFALGEFFRAAKKEPFWTNTVFVVLADHGARVYGRQSIPIHSYEIPFVVLGPAVVDKPSRIGALGSSLDVAPTLLGLIGRPYETMFFGRDLLLDPDEPGRACLNHNRDIGMLTHDTLAVLGLMNSVEFYSGNPKKVEMKLNPSPDAAAREVMQDTVAIFQVADDLYVHERYRIDGAPAETQTLSPAQTNTPAGRLAGR